MATSSSSSMAAARARPADEGRRPPDVWGRSSSIKSCVAGGVAAGLRSPLAGLRPPGDDGGRSSGGLVRRRPNRKQKKKLLNIEIFF